MAPEEVPAGDVTCLVADDDDGDEALRQIENELALMEEAMSDRQRSLAEVNQRLIDLRGSPSCHATAAKPSLDAVAEAESAEEMGITPLLRNSRSVSSGVGEVAVEGAPLNGHVGNGIVGAGASAMEAAKCAVEVARNEFATVHKALGAEDMKVQELLQRPTKPCVLQPRSNENLCSTGLQKANEGPRLTQRWQESCEPTVKRIAAVASGADATAPHVTRMYSLPTRTDTTRPPRPLVLTDSSNGVQSRGTARSSYFNSAVAVSSTSPFRSATLPQQASSDSLSRGPSPAPATPRGSSMPADARRIFSTAVSQGTASVASPHPSVGSPRSQVGIPMAGSLTPLTPRLPLHAVRTSSSGYPSAPTVTLSTQTLEGTPRARSVSASSASAPSAPTSTGGNLSARQVGPTAFAQYGNRFSAVTTAATSSTSMSAVRTSSRNNTPQSRQPTAGTRFVPISAAPSSLEAHRGRDTSQGLASSVPRGGSPTPGVQTMPFASSAAVRQSSVVRPSASFGGPVRQASTGSPSTGSCTPQAGAYGASAVVSAAGEDMPPAASRALSPPHVAAVAAAAAAAVSSASSGRNGLQHHNTRHTLGACNPASNAQQPSRYAYVNSATRRDGPVQPNPRDLRRRGRH